ncbi:MAG: purine-binding chemotaxis protein CheW [Acidobacteria bacterium]|nr:purine-binding chemotaxis protein CheW [Acidobacteriota bacterium]
MRQRREQGHKPFIGWDVLRQKMAGLLLDENAEVDGDGLEALLAKRAEQLAKTAKNDQLEQSLEVLVFELEQERYALETQYFSEVIQRTHLTRIPGVPDFVLGVISRRMEIVSVIDLAKFLGLTQHHSRQTIVFIDAPHLSLGFAVDCIVEITKLAPSAIQSLPSQLSGEQAQYLLGVTAAGIALLNLQELLCAQHLMVDQG